MYRVPLAAIPNQRLSVRLDGALFAITVKLAVSVMCVSIDRDGETVVAGQRCVPDVPLIPYRYLEGDAGNFVFVTAGGEYPHYSRFGGTDALLYGTAAELAELRHG